LASSNTGYCFLTMFPWYPVMDLARAPRRAARKKGSGYENVMSHVTTTSFILKQFANTCRAVCNYENPTTMSNVIEALPQGRYCFISQHCSTNVGSKISNDNCRSASLKSKFVFPVTIYLSCALCARKHKMQVQIFKVDSSLRQRVRNYISHNYAYY
jgi:hypothetical protein